MRIQRLAHAQIRCQGERGMSFRRLARCAGSESNGIAAGGVSFDADGAEHAAEDVLAAVVAVRAGAVESD
jgi:hypothetical protein